MNSKIPSEQIREIWQEMKEMNRLFEDYTKIDTEGIDRYNELRRKYEPIDILFGRESTLSKAIIYFLDKPILTKEQVDNLKI